MIEVKPAVCALSNIEKIKKQYSGKIIASGFITDVELIHKLYDNGFDGIMTSRQNLWNNPFNKL
jgi:glycerol-3-phosphate responsive antiterminator